MSVEIDLDLCDGNVLKPATEEIAAAGRRREGRRRGREGRTSPHEAQGDLSPSGLRLLWLRLVQLFDGGVGRQVVVDVLCLMDLFCSL